MRSIKETKISDGYYDDKLERHIVPVIAGNCNWTRSMDIAYSTTLGSCLSVCAYDKSIGIGGINHFLLPQAKDSENIKFSESFRYGSAAIESLLNILYANGAAKNGLTIKIFGGANVLKNASTDIGQKNLNFAKNFFHRENLRIESEDVGGFSGRKLIFYPVTGRVLLRSIGDQDQLSQIAKEELVILNRASALQGGNDVELF